ncbi:hypothetical protein OROHE_018493 [Orobanche hederae]
MSLITSSCHPTVRLPCNDALISPPLRVSMAMVFNSVTFPFCPCPFLDIPKRSFVVFAKKKNSQPGPVLNPSAFEDVSMVDEEGDDGIEDDVFLQGSEDDELIEDDGFFDDDYFAEEAEPSVGDGAGGGGILLSGTEWEKRAFDIAEEVTVSFDGELGIYAFRTLLNATIQVRIEQLTNKSGSPSLTDIEDFTIRYRARLNEAEATRSIPGNISLEVSSPGVERIVRIPQDLERFKEHNLYVKYVAEAADTATGSSSEQDGVFRLVSYDPDASSCAWGLANVRLNREKSGKGRPLSKKQKEWRLKTPFDSLRLVRLYSEI